MSLERVPDDGAKLSLEPLNTGGEGVSRRTAIKYGSIGAGLLVATPTILTLGASPASASGDGATKYALTADTTGRSIALSITGPGLWVLAYFVRGNNSNATNVGVSERIVINSPSPGTWTQLVAQRGTNVSSGLNNRITMRAFYLWEDPALWDENLDTPKTAYTATLAYAAGTAPNQSLTGLVRGAAGYNFPNATTATDVKLSNIGSGSVAETTATALGSRFLFITGGIHSSTLTSSAPSGFTGTSNSLDTSANSTSGSIAIGSYLSTTKVNAGTASGAVSAVWNTTPTTQASFLVSIG